MAVDAVNGVNSNSAVSSTNSTSEVTDASRVTISEATLAKMTAKEIIDGYNHQSWAVPDNILSWAQNEYQTNPDSKVTFGESGNSVDTVNGTQTDVVSYRESMEADGLSLKEQCNQLASLSAQMEVTDLNNITKIAPYSTIVPTDQGDGNQGESEVSKVLSEFAKDMMKGGLFFFVTDKFKEGKKFFAALKKGTNDELGDINTELETMQAELNQTLSGAKQSKQTGIETIEAGKELKSHTKWWQFFGSRRRAAKKAIEQGDKTVKMSDRTSKFANAIAKDNNIALQSIQTNIQVVTAANAPEEPKNQTEESSGSLSQTPAVSSQSGDI